jgi:Tol biopolymer transport system component/predicted Ser/Thr protein kinase
MTMKTHPEALSKGATYGGKYQIIEKIGQGGMGVVYKAQDLRLDRFVALKILSPERVADPDRKRRFVQEAKAASALNHPHIITVYDIGQEGGTDFIAMEFVTGKTLTGLVRGRGLKVNEALKYGIQIADALSAAHEAGIIHRDLKPDNVMVTDGGLVKVLDFGLAKLVEPDRREEPAGMQTLTTPTEEGMIVGTVAYMSPEQAEGKKVDARSDIFSFGAVLYEMVAGRRAFQEDSRISILSAIVRQDPKPLSTGVPHELARIVTKCLRKDAARRIQHMDDVKIAMEDLWEELDAGKIEPISVRTSAARRWGLAAGVGVVAIVVGIAAGKLWMSGARPARSPVFTQLTDQPGAELFPSLSPDGNSFIYAGRDSDNWDIYFQRVGSTVPANLTTDSEADDTQPAFSPDGQRIAFRSEREGGGIFVMGASGESVRRITDFGYHPAWSPDGSEIVCSTISPQRPEVRPTVHSELYIVNITTSQKRLLAKDVYDAVQPHWSPHGHRIAFWGMTPASWRDIYTISSDGTGIVQITNDAALDWNPVWSPDGEYLYFVSDRGGSMNVWRVPMDEETGKALRAPEPVTASSAYVSHISLAGNGRRVSFAQQLRTGNVSRSIFDPIRETAVGSPIAITQGSRDSLYPAVSPDGAWLAFTSRGKQEDLCLVQADGSGLRRLSDDVYRDRQPAWSPDGKTLLFMSDRRESLQIWSIHRDGSGLKQLTESSQAVRYPVISPDGRFFTYHVPGEGSYLMEFGKPWKDQTPVRLPSAGDLQAEFWPNDWSEDGRLLAGILQRADGTAAGIGVFSLETRNLEIIPVSGRQLFPRWLSDNRRLLFHADGKIHLVDTQTKRKHVVLSIPGYDIDPYFDLSKDGRSIYFVLQAIEADLWLIDFE